MSELCHDIFLSVGARLRQRIVFDATTSHGSSGTPMFGESGKVIGMSFAVLVDDTRQILVSGYKAQSSNSEELDGRPPIRTACVKLRTSTRENSQTRSCNPVDRSKIRSQFPKLPLFPIGTLIAPPSAQPFTQRISDLRSTYVQLKEIAGRSHCRAHALWR